MSAYEVVVSLLSSASAGGLSCALLNPLDTLKVRYQVTPMTKGGMTLGAFAREVVATEGLVKGLWAPGVLANGLGIGLSSMGRVGLYPYIRDAMLSLSSSQNNAVFMFASGLLAGALGYLVSSPVYQVKTLAQAESGVIGADGLLATGARKGHAPVHHGKSLIASLATLAREGALFRGAGALVVRGAVLSAGQQVGYDGLKTEARRRCIPDGPAVHVAASIAGALGATVASTPADVVMTRFQAAATTGHKYDGLLDCVATIYRTDGPLGFYRGFVPFFVRLCPVFVISLPLTEHLRFLFGLGYL